MRRFVALPLLLLSSVAFAQAPQLLVKNPHDPAAKPHPIALAKADVHVVIGGPLAQTTMTLTFTNDADRVLEGELVFPLPENATVSRYGLDVDGRIVDAVTIEKEKARAVFETEVRKGIDPGLVEQVQGNNFRTRVYPIPAKGSRTVRVQYVAEAAGHGDQLVYALPVHWPGSTPALSLKIEAVATQAPAVDNVPGLTFDTTGDRHVAERKFEKAQFGGAVVARLPAAGATRPVVERRSTSTVSAENFDPKTAEQFARTEHYFVLSDLPRLEGIDRDAMAAKPGRIAVVWDASLSRENADHAKEFELLERHLKATDVDFDLIVLRNAAEPPVAFNVGLDGVAKLIAHLKALPYDGGTALSALRVARNYADLLPPERGGRLNRPQDYGYYLLFTDGLSNLGPDLPAQVEAPVVAISTGPRSNHTLLRRLASTSGGQYLNLQSLTTDQALAAMADKPGSLMSIDAKEGEVADVYPRLPHPVQGRVTVAGRLLARSATVTLNYGRGGQVLKRVPVTLTQDGAADGDLAPRYWAQLKVTDLSAAADKNEREITDLGKRFDLVTPFTSMIVLETVEQHLLHKIVPPKSRANVYAEFVKRIEQQQSVARTEEKAKIDRVVAMWEKRLAWWDKEFKYPADFKYQATARNKADGAAPAAEDRAHVLRGAAATPALQPVDARNPAAPAPRTAPAAEPRATAGGRVVTVDTLSQRVPDFDNAPSLGLQRNGEGRGRGTASAGGRGDVPPDGSGGLFGGGNEAQIGQQGQVREFREALTRRELREQAGNRPAGGYRTATAVDDPVATRPTAGGAVSFRAGADVAIAVKEPLPEAPYVKALQAAPPAEAYAVYLDQRKAHGSTPAFYLDAADVFAKSDPATALRVLTNIPELALDDGRLLRIAAHRLQQVGQLDLAIDLFERITRLRPEEPQSFRDLATALADRADRSQAAGDPARARSDRERAVDLLHKVVMNPWARFEEIETIALIEANRLLAKSPSDVKNPFDPRLTKPLTPDVRIVLTWDTDNTDIDLHVVEPSGEECFYGHNLTTIGGAVSRDFTQGYGPEEYVLRRAMPGEYKIMARFFGNRDQRLLGPTTVQATVITHYGTPQEKRESLTLRLKDAKDMVEVGKITVK
jgi:hypothetical protein